jgi:hypothetical protein
MIRFLSWTLVAWLVGSAGAAWVVVELAEGAR